MYILWMRVAVAAFICCVALSSAACSPTEKDARGWYKKRQGTFDEIEKQLFADMELFPYAGDTFACPPPKPPAAAAPQPILPDLECHNAFTEYLMNAGSKKEAAFYEATSAKWLDSPQRGCGSSRRRAGSKRVARCASEAVSSYYPRQPLSRAQ